jgi:hypothetical protein
MKNFIKVTYIDHRIGEHTIYLNIINILSIIPVNKFSAFVEIITIDKGSLKIVEDLDNIIQQVNNGTQT